MGMVPLFSLAGRSRRHWEPAVVEAAVGKVAEALGYLEGYIGGGRGAGGPRPTPRRGGRARRAGFRTPHPLENLPRLAGYWRAIQTDPLAARLIEETRQAIRQEQERSKALAS